MDWDYIYWFSTIMQALVIAACAGLLLVIVAGFGRLTGMF